MKTALILVMTSYLILPACISFSIRPPDLPGNLLEEMVLCKSVDTSQDQWRPRDIKDTFPLDDGSLVCLVKIRYVEREIRLRWRWYSPQGELVKDTGDVSVNSESRYLDEVTAYDTFRYETETEAAGTWTAVFFINNSLTGKRSFSIGKKDESEPESMTLRQKGRSYDLLR